MTSGLRFRGAVVEETGRDFGRQAARVSHVVAPATAAFNLIDSHEKCGDDLPQFDEHLVGAIAGLCQRARAKTQQQRLERLTGTVNPKVRLRRSRQQASQGVERLGPDR